MKTKIGKHLRIVLLEMHRRVGLKKLIISDEEWYMKKTWTWRQEDRFVEWFEKYLKNSKEARDELMPIPIASKQNIERYVSAFIFYCGWRYKEEV